MEVLEKVEGDDGMEEEWESGGAMPTCTHQVNPWPAPIRTAPTTATTQVQAPASTQAQAAPVAQARVKPHTSTMATPLPLRLATLLTLCLATPLQEGLNGAAPSTLHQATPLT